MEIVVNIQRDSMKGQLCLYSKLVKKFHNFQFCYPGRRDIQLEESHYNEEMLFGVRFIAFIYLTGIYVWALASMPSLTTNVIFLTMIGYLMTWIYFAVTLQHHILGKYKKLSLYIKSDGSLPKFIELIFEIALCAEVPITIVFWTILLPIVLDMPDVTTETLVIQGNLHAAPLIFLLIDTFFNCFSFPLRHVSVLIVFTVLYLILNMTYSLLVKPIYKPLSWVDVQSYILALGCLLATLLVHFVVRYLYRHFKAEKLNQKDEERRNLLRYSQRTSLTEQLTIQRTSSENQPHRHTVEL